MSSAVKGVIGLVATVAIAAVVAYGVSAPRNVDAVMNQDMAALGGRSMNDHMAEAYTKAADERCAKFTEMAAASLGPRHRTGNRRTRRRYARRT